MHLLRPVHLFPRHMAPIFEASLHLQLEKSANRGLGSSCFGRINVFEDLPSRLREASFLSSKLTSMCASAVARYRHRPCIAPRSTPDSTDMFASPVAQEAERVADRSLFEGLPWRTQAQCDALLLL